MEKGGIIGSGVYEPGKVKNTTVMERAYQMGKTYKREFGRLRTKKPSVFGLAWETCLTKTEGFFHLQRLALMPCRSDGDFPRNRPDGAYPRRGSAW